jgi:hypothetical protein
MGMYSLKKVRHSVCAMVPIFCFRDGKPDHNTQNCIVYDPDFRYELTGETFDTRWWYKDYKTDKETKSKLGYSRIGLGNV